MKFAPKSKRRSDLRRSHQLTAPAVIEHLEDRMLLTVPEITVPEATDGVITNSRPEITWDAVDGAVSYDLWISSLETYTTLQVHTELTGNSFTPTEELTLGSLRIWARANFADDSSGAWTTGFDLRLEATPEVIGPVGTGSRNLITDTTPTIEWNSAPGAIRFQVFIRDDTAVVGRQETIDNTSEEIREWTVPDDEALEMGQYTAWVRSVDRSGRVSDWSTPFRFDVGPEVNIIGPSAPSFDSSPLLQWEAVDRATEYEVYVIEHDFDTEVTDGAIEPLYQTTVTGTSFQIPVELPDGGYAFWVRAINRTPGKATVVGAWGSPTQFATLRAPVIEVPSAIEHEGEMLTTQAMPTLEWTRIDGAARYEIWVNRSNTRPPYLQDTSIDNSYTFESRLPEGRYFIWVRAVSTRGEFSDWSPAYVLETTGGRPLITSPTQNEQAVDFTFTWIGFEEAVSYEIWVDHVGVDYTFINVDGITETTYQHPDPLPLGNFRLWVRALFEDGSYSAWSIPVSFEAIAELDDESRRLEPSALLASVDTDVQAVPRHAETRVPEAVVAEAARPVQPPAPQHDDHTNGKGRQSDAAGPVARSLPVTPDQNLPLDASGSPFEALPTDILTQLAEECVDAEWWGRPEATA